jgi:UDP:flavonoid glycosyltransferase YjiC (YdhE family)
MRILYRVNGEGMGHATRSEVVIGSLLASHDVRVVASGAAYRHLRERLPRVDEIFGPSFALDHGEIQRWATLRQNVQHAVNELPDTVKRWIGEVDEWKQHRDYLLARAVTHSMVPGAMEYIVTTFFHPPLAKGGTTLVPPIIRPEIVDTKPGRGEHLVVYSSGDPRELEALRGCGMPARVYGMRGGPDKVEVDGNLELRPRSSADFVESLRTSRAVVAGGGFSLLSEAVYLHKPIVSVPLHGQFEQVMNARYVERLGYGQCADEVGEETLREFIERIAEFESALEGYQQEGNAHTLKTIAARADAAVAAQPRERRRARRAASRAAG